MFGVKYWVCDVVLYAHSSLANILLRKREQVVLLVQCCIIAFIYVPVSVFQCLFLGAICWPVIRDCGISGRTVKSVQNQPLSKRPKIGFEYQLSLNAGQNYYKREHSAIRSAFNELPYFTKIFVWSIFEWPFYAGFTVFTCFCLHKPLIGMLLNMHIHVNGTR